MEDLVQRLTHPLLVVGGGLAAAPAGFWRCYNNTKKIFGM